MLKTKLILVLLGMGSGDDLNFIMKGSRPFISMRRKKGGQKTTANGAFTKKSKAGVVDLTFLECSKNKRYTLFLISKYQGEAPKFDLIIGTKTMHKLGIVLDCQNNTVTIDSNCCPCKTSIVCLLSIVGNT